MPSKRLPRVKTIEAEVVRVVTTPNRPIGSQSGSQLNFQPSTNSQTLEVPQVPLTDQQRLLVDHFGELQQLLRSVDRVTVSNVNEKCDTCGKYGVKLYDVNLLFISSRICGKCKKTAKTVGNIAKVFLK